MKYVKIYQDWPPETVAQARLRIRSRIRILNWEISHNKEENWLMEDEIDKLEAQLEELEK